jgi:hypothetical protein
VRRIVANTVTVDGRTDLRGEDLAQLDAPLVEGVDAPDRPLCVGVKGRSVSVSVSRCVDGSVGQRRTLIMAMR